MWAESGSGVGAAGDPHGGEPLRWTGAPAAGARGGVVAVHGRGATAENILTLAPELGEAARDLAWVAPQAAGFSWYPYSFLAPREQNQPGLSSALIAIGRAVEALVERGVPRERIVLLGFSQGACLAQEFAFRNPRRWGGVVGLSGGLMGPPGTTWEAASESGGLVGTPVFLGCADPDPHIPRERVEESAQVFMGLGAEVTMKIYPGMGHTVNDDELRRVRELLEGSRVAWRA